MSITHASIAFAAGAFAACSAFGQVQTFDVRKVRDFRQVSPAQPTSPQSTFIQIGLRTASSGDAASVDVTLPDGVTSVGLNGNPNWFFVDSASSVSLLDATYPPGTYTFSTSGGSVGSLSSSVDLRPSSLFPPVPFFTGDSWGNLQALDPNADLTLSFDSFLPAPGSNDSFIDILINNFDPVVVFFERLEPTGTSVLIPAGTLQPNTSYAASLSFSDHTSTPDAGFGGATSFDGLVSRTRVDFTTVPEPSSLSLLLLPALALVLRRRR